MLGVIQIVTEDELDYRTHLNDAVARCEVIQFESEKMRFFVDGLLPCTRPIVARFCGSTHRDEITFEFLVNFAKDEGFAY